MARLIAVMGRLTDDKDSAAALFLIYHMAALAEHLADLRETQQRLHQVRDARRAVERLLSLTQAARHGTQPLEPSLIAVGGTARLSAHTLGQSL
jgi:hypothetical protein